MASAGNVRAGGAYVEIFAKDGAFQQALTRVQNKMKAVGTSMRQIGSGLSIGGAAIGAPFVLAARSATDFTIAMAQVKSNTGATAAEMEKLDATSRSMGKQFGRIPQEVAVAMSDLAKAGLDANGVIQSIGPILAVAAADGMDLSRAVDVVVSSMSQFGLTTNDFGAIADKLQAAANASVTSVDLIGESLSYVGPQAQAAGQSFDNVAAALATMAQGGIKGSMAGTQLARVLEAMTAEEGKFNELGVSVRDAQGNLRPFMDVLRDLGAATGGMNNGDRLKTFMDIFDIRGARAAITLSQLGGEFKNILGEIQNSQGAAAAKAATVMASFGGAVKQLISQFEDLKITIITSMGSVATSTVQAFGKMLAIVTGFVARNPAIVASVAALAGGMLTVGVIAIAGGVALQVMARGIGVFGAALRIIPALLTPVGAAIGLLAIGIGAAVVVARQLSPAFKRETDGIMDAIMQLDFGTAWSIMNLNFAIALTQMAQQADSVLGTVKGFFAATGAFIGDKLIEGLDRFMGLFGADIITLQTSLQQLGVYLRAAFDWDFALNGMSEALAKIDTDAEKARAKTPTADARATEREKERQAAADRRQQDSQKSQDGWQGTVDELRQDLERAHESLKPKTEEAQAAAATVGGVVPAAGPGGVMAPGAAAAAAGGGVGQTASTFSSLGEGLGIGPELNKLEDPAKQTAANTAATAQAVQRMAGGPAGAAAVSPAVGGLQQAAAGGGLAGPGLGTGGAVAASTAAGNLPGAAAQAQAGMNSMSVTGGFEKMMQTNFALLISAVQEHAKISAGHTAKFDKLIENTGKLGGAFV